MTSRRVRVSCPNCTRDLHIRVEALGRKGECKHCGHRFRAEAAPSSDSWPAGPGPSSTGSDEEVTESLALMVEALEREFQQTWAQFTARQTTVLEQLCDRFASQVAPSSVAGRVEVERLSAMVQDAQALVGPGMPPLAEVEGGLGPLIRERDLAQAECARLRDEALSLRSKLADRSAEVGRLARSIEERDALRTERDALAAEATEVRARLVELEFSLVEAESAREEARERSKAEQRKWRRQRHALIAEARRRLAEQRRQAEAERRAWGEQLAVYQAIEHEGHSLRAKVKKLRDLYDATRQERDEALRAVETLTQQRARLGAWLDEAEAERREANRIHQAEIDRLAEALEEALTEAESAQDELARQRREPSATRNPAAP